MDPCIRVGDLAGDGLRAGDYIVDDSPALSFELLR